MFEKTNVATNALFHKKYSRVKEWKQCEMIYAIIRSKQMNILCRIIFHKKSGARKILIKRNY